MKNASNKTLELNKKYYTVGLNMACNKIVTSVIYKGAIDNEGPIDNEGRYDIVVESGNIRMKSNACSLYETRKEVKEIIKKS